jgi:hypothetical protein
LSRYKSNNDFSASHVMTVSRCQSHTACF